jgi:hypothetical protein
MPLMSQGRQIDSQSPSGLAVSADGPAFLKVGLGIG